MNIGSAPRRSDPEAEKEDRRSRRFRRFAKKPNFIARSISITSRRSCARIAASSKRRRTDDCRDLIELENLRGTFHCHTTASDGHNSLEEMADAAQELGLQYLGIADHSRSSIQAHGLDDDALARANRGDPKAERELRRLPLFAGVECDILRDGALDFDDERLARTGLRRRLGAFRFQPVRSGNDASASFARSAIRTSRCWRIRPGACF